MFTVVTRSPWILQDYASLQGAIDAGMKLGVPFDVHTRGGNGPLGWWWELRS